MDKLLMTCRIKDDNNVNKENIIITDAKEENNIPCRERFSLKQIKHVFTNDEMADIYKKFGVTVAEIIQLEKNKKACISQIESDIDVIKAEQTRLIGKIRDGYEYRSIGNDKDTQEKEYGDNADSSNVVWSI